MISGNKKFKQLNWKVIIIILLSIIISLFATTKIIYDSCFQRYDAEEVEIPKELQNMVDARQSITFLSGKNQLQGYLYSGNRDMPQQGLVVFAPGFHAGMDTYLWQIQSLSDYGWDVFIFDSTGSCESEGRSSIGFSQELLDLDAALTHIEQNYDYEHIFLLGHSRGGYAVCGILNSEHSIDAAISISGINSAMEAIMEPVTRYVGPIAYSNYPLLWFYQAILFDADTVSTQAYEEISNSHIPTLIVQGNADTIVPMEKGSIYAHRYDITSDCAEYYICSNPGQNGHLDLMFDPDGTANDILMQKINEFYYNTLIQD